MSKKEIEEYNANNMSVLSFMPYRSVTPDEFGRITANLDEEEIYYLRNDVTALIEINTQLCSILNNAQIAFSVQSFGGPRREWIPSEKDIKKVYSKAGHGWHVPRYAEDERRIDGNFVQTQFGDKKGYSTAVPKGKGIVFNSIEHSFQYLVDSLGEVNGFEVIRQSPE